MKNKTIRITEKELKKMIENKLNHNIQQKDLSLSDNLDEVISIDSETAEKDPDLVKKLQDKIGDKDIIKISESYVRKLIEQNEHAKISKNKLLKLLNIKK